MRPVRRLSQGSPEAARPVVSVLIATLLFLQSGAPLFVAHAQAVTRSRAEVAAQTRAALEALAAAVDDVPRTTFDVGAALAAAGGTVEAAFSWVRDTTLLVPYQGSLRGPVGVLLDGSGNSLDRALLLVAMVEAAGGRARLAHGVLTGDELAAAVAAMAPAGRGGSAVGAPATADLSGYVDRFALDPAFVAEATTAAEADGAALEAGLASRVSPQTNFLLELVPELAGATHDRSAALRDHWWAQYQLDGAWVDLDPTLADARPGTALGTATEFVEADALPVDLRHTLQLDVVLECAVDGALAEHVLARSESFDAGSLLGQRLAVQHVPVAMSDDLDPSTDQAAFEELVLAQDTWFPTISLGAQSLYDLQFTSDCEVTTATAPWLGSAVAGALDRATDLFGDLFGPPPEDAVTALFIDYHLHVPGEGERTVRRQVFDVLGSAARAAGVAEATVDPGERLAWRLALLGETEVLVTPGRVSEPFVTDLVSRALLAKREAVLALADTASPEEADAVASASEPGVPLPSALYGLALARQRDMPAGVYVDALTVLNRHNTVRIGDGGVLSRVQAFDIVTNGVASVSGSVTDVLAQGVRDTNAETVLSGVLCGSALTAEFCRPLGNPADDLALTGADSSGAWAVVRDRNDVAAVGLDWSADALAALGADLDAGYLAVVPTGTAPAPGAAGWWRVDPVTGSTLGVDELGWGPSAAEYAMILNHISFAFCMAGSISGGVSPGSVVLCTFGFASGTGAILAAGNVAGVLAIVSALLYGFGGMGYPRN